MKKDRDSFILTALCLHFGEGWEKRPDIDIWEREKSLQLFCLISETDEFFKFSYIRTIFSTKEEIAIKNSFAYLSKKGMVWDLNEEEEDDIPNAGEGKQDDMV